jgi:hypothetical protein
MLKYKVFPLYICIIEKDVIYLQNKINTKRKNKMFTTVTIDRKAMIAGDTSPSKGTFV